jgi:hypothetical protein
MKKENAPSAKQGLDKEHLSKNIIAETTTQAQCPPIIDAELFSLKMGWHVVPLHTPVPGGCSCGCSHIQPVCQNLPIPDPVPPEQPHPSLLKEWWHRWPGSNVGVVTGKRSGIVVLHVDPSLEGDKALAGLNDFYKCQIDTLTAETGSGKKYYYFSHPGVTLPNTTVRLAAGLCLCGEGEIIPSPHSIEASGKFYRWVKGLPGPNQITPLPDWMQLQALLDADSLTRKRSFPWQKDLRHELYSHFSEDILVGLARHLLGKLGDPGLVLACVEAVNYSFCEDPLPDGEIESLFLKVYKSRLRRKRKGHAA